LNQLKTSLSFEVLYHLLTEVLRQHSCSKCVVLFCTS